MCSWLRQLKQNKTMATAFSYSTGVVHFRYPSQKVTANPVLAQFQKTTAEHSHNIFHSANPVLGHAMTKLFKPLHITRIGIRALHNSCSSEIGFNDAEGKFQKCHHHQISSERVKYDCEDRILEVLKSKPGTNLTKLAEDLSNTLKHIGTHREEKGGLVHLYKKILAPVHISIMWEIAGYNDTNKAVDMLLLENHSPGSRVKWGGRTVNVKGGTSGQKRKSGDEDSQKPLKQFPMEGEWEMKLQWCGNGEEYTVEFKDKSSLLARKKKGQVFVKKNLNGIPDGVKPSDLAFVFGADGPWPSSNPFVIYMRAAGPNVLIGQAWTGGENSQRRWAEVVVVKKVGTA